MSSINLHSIDFKKFIQAVNMCKGDVFLVTSEGDKLNLKSRLCQLIGLAEIVEGGKIGEAQIICENPEDDSFLFRFNLYGDKILDKQAENC